MWQAQRKTFEEALRGAEADQAAARPSISSAATPRARASASPSDSNEWTGSAGSSASVSSITAAMSRKPNRPAEERVHRDLVGRVQRAWRGPARERGLARQPQAGERVDVDLLERQRAQLDQIERADGDVHPLGVMQRV